MAEDGADDDQRRHSDRQIDAHSDPERRQRPSAPAAAKQFVDDHCDHADRGAEGHQVPVQRPAENPLRDRRDQRRLRCRKRVGPGARGTDEPEAAVQEIEHRRNDDGAEDHSEYERELLPPGCRRDELSGFQVLQVVVGNRRHAEDDRRHEQGEGDQRPGRIGVGNREEQCQQDRDAEHRQDADARDRAVRCPDEARHVAADGGDHDPGDEHVDDADRQRAGGVGGDRVGVGEGVEQQPDRDHRQEDHRADDGDRDVPLGDVDARVAAGAPRAVGGQRGDDPPGDRSDDLEQGPDRGDPDRAGPDEPHFLAKDRVHEIGKLGAGRSADRGEIGQQDDEADDDPGQHRQADAQADEMADAKVGERQTRGEVGRPRTDPKRARGLLGDELHLAQQRVSRRHDRPDDHRREAAPVLLGAADARADLEHLGRGDSFGIGQVAAGDERPAQRHRIHDPEDSADGDDGDRQPVGKTGPPADHHQAGKHEHDRRQSARRRGDRLDDIVLLDGRIAEGLEHGHRDHRGGDRGREGQPRAQAEIDVGGGEHDGDQSPEDDPADRQLADVLARAELFHVAWHPTSSIMKGNFPGRGSNGGEALASVPRRTPRRPSAARNPR